MAARLTAYLVVAIVGATLIAGLMVGAQRDDNEGPVDLIVHNGTVYTADRRGAMAEAVAVRGNQILRVGTDREILRLQLPQTIVVDAGGGAVLPGFNDAHVRLLDAGLAEGSVDLTGARSAGDVVERVGAWGSEHPGEQWIVGRGWSAEHFRSSFPARHLLDSAAGGRPVLMLGADGVTAWANSAALDLAGITRDTPDPARGLIVREARSGDPSGVLRGTAAGMVRARIPAATREAHAGALAAAVARANAAGITSVHTLDGTQESLGLYDEFRRAGDLTLRIYAALPVLAPFTEAVPDHVARAREQYPDDPLFKTGALYIRLDDSFDGRAPSTFAPYAGADQRTETAIGPDDLNRTVRLADAAGWQVVTHAAGDAAVKMALDAYAHAVRSNRVPERGRRHRIEHLALVGESDIPRFASLGVLASLQPALAQASAERMDAGRIPDPEDAAQMFPFRALSEHARLVFGSAWPSGELDPLTGLHVAVNRPLPGSGITTAAGSRGSPERVPLKRALDAYTASGAWASFDDQRKGALSPGMLADIVVLTDNIFEGPASALASTTVAYTIFDGRIVYSQAAETPHHDFPPGTHTQ